MRRGVIYLASVFSSDMPKSASVEFAYSLMRSRVRLARLEAQHLTQDGWTVVDPLALSDGIELACNGRGWLLRCLRLVAACDVVSVPSDWQKSRGCVREVRWARMLGKRVQDRYGEVLYPARWLGFTGWTQAEVEEGGLLLGKGPHGNPYAYVTPSGVTEIEHGRLTPEQLRTLADIAEAVSLYGAETVRGELGS